MEKRFKVADFAESIGCTPKTVYKMIERNELITTTEKVNNRETTVIVATEKQLRELQIQFGKLPVKEGECNEIVTDVNGKEPVMGAPGPDILEKIMEMSREYTERLTTVNEELVTAKSRMLFLTDKVKADEDSKTYWQQEYFKKDYEVKEVQKGKFRVTIILLSVIFVLLLGLLTLGLLFSFEKQKNSDDKDLTGKITVTEAVTTSNNPTQVVQSGQQPVKTLKKPTQAKRNK